MVSNHHLDSPRSAEFITSCPSSNPALPFKAFPALTVSPAAPNPGDKVTVKYNGTDSNVFLSLFTGLSTYSLPLSGGSATLPSNLTGTVYAVVSSNGTAVTDDTIVAGPAILLFPVPTSQ